MLEMAEVRMACPPTQAGEKQGRREFGHFCLQLTEGELGGREFWGSGLQLRGGVGREGGV